MPPDAILEAPVHRTKTDPARFEVVKNALYSAAEEMKIVLNGHPGRLGLSL